MFKLLYSLVTLFHCRVLGPLQGSNFSHSPKKMEPVGRKFSAQIFPMVYNYCSAFGPPCLISTIHFKSSFFFFHFKSSSADVAYSYIVNSHSSSSASSFASTSPPPKILPLSSGNMHPTHRKPTCIALRGTTWEVRIDSRGLWEPEKGQTKLALSLVQQTNWLLFV